MKRLLTALAVFSLLAMAVSLWASAPNSAAAQTEGPIKSVTAITEVFGDGQKITAVAVEYEQEIDNSKLSPSAFSVEGRTITNVYANTSPAKAAQGVNGKYVIIELSTDDAGASILVQSFGAKPPADDQSTETPQPNGTPNAQGPGGPGGMSITRNEVKVSVTQTGEIITADGKKYAANSQGIINDKVINLVVDDFQQLEYQDPKTGKTLMYNLYVPKNYDPNKSYPLVLFMHDAGATSTEPDRTLIQGLGAVIWATPEEQAKHESFVLAPQYSTQVVNDNSEASEYLDITVDLINSLTSQYNIDTNRLYTTGQSGGCMMSIAMDIKYPDLFAASLLVAGQWDAALVSPMANDKLWIIVSEGDLKAFPGMNAITAALEEKGAKVSRATWSGLSTPEEFTAEVSKMMAEDSNIKYTVLQKGTVVPAGQMDDGGSNHINTWRIAYTIEGVRDWLFAQTKAPSEATAAEASTSDPTKDDAYAEALTFDNNAWNYDAENDVYWQIGVQYAATPETLEYETLGIYVPGAYMTATANGDGTYSATINAAAAINGYTAATAPIVLPVETPGYSAHKAPTAYSYDGVSSYLQAGFIYLDPGMRGRSNGYDDSGNLIYSGGAPWGVTDMKAAIRYYRYNQDILPGNTDSIFTFGMSGGGAQSTLMGATGDSELYYPYLESIGAAMYDTNGTYISDAVSGTMAWCPITSLDYADAAYEWNMGQYASTGTRADDTWTSALSDDLAKAYAEYVNELGLKDKNGTALVLEPSENGIYTAGSYYDYVVAVVEESLNNFLVDTTFPYTETVGGFMGPGGPGGPPDDGIQRDEGGVPAGGPPAGEMAEAEATPYETVQDYMDALNAEGEWVTYNAETNTATITNIADFVAYGSKTPNKSVGAFDDLNLSQGENQLFGNDDRDASHFDFVLADLLAENQADYAAYADWDAAYVEAYATDLQSVDKLGNSIQYRQNMYNPMYYLLDYYDGYQTSTVAKHWRIHTGIEQGDTASTVELNLALALENYDGVEDVEFTTVWGQGHTKAERTGDSTDNFIAWVNEVANK